jgi:hypothetical protein
MPTVYLSSAGQARPPWLTGALIGLGAVALAVILITVAVRGRRSSRPTRPDVPVIVAAPEPSKPQGPEVLPTMTVKSEPPGAQVKASWPGGSLLGVTPFTFAAPRGAAIHLEFSLADHEPGKMDLTLDQPKLAEMQMVKSTGRQVRKTPRRPKPEGPPSDPRTTTKELDESVPIKDDFGDEQFGKSE